MKTDALGKKICKWCVNASSFSVESFKKNSCHCLCSSDGKESKEDDEEVSERNEPPRQEGRVRQTRVWPQTQTPPGRKEEIRLHWSQINLLFLDCWYLQPHFSCVSTMSWISMWVGKHVINSPWWFSVLRTVSLQHPCLYLGGKVCVIHSPV